MPNVTSKNLRGATELTLIAPIKPGFVPTAETLTYGARLRRLLGTLFVSRKRACETDLAHVPAGGLESLRTLRFVHWTIFDDDSRLLLAVSFDGPWESYIQGIVDRAGYLLDVIFCHCRDFEGHSSDLGYEKFSQWVRDRQIGCDFIYDADPDLTTEDVRYLKKFEQLYASTVAKKPDEFAAEFALKAAKLHVDEPNLAPPDPARYNEVLLGLWRRRPEFAGAADDVRFFDRAARMLSFAVRPPGPLQLPPGPELESFRTWAAQIEALDPPKPPPATEVPLEAPDTIQGNILESYENVTHGCLLFVQFNDAAGGASFLAGMRPLITTHEPPQSKAAGAKDGTKFNLGLTYQGLRRLTGQDAVLDQFPKEFREGLADRASMLGMAGYNHARNWAGTLPRTFDDAPIPLETIDAVVILQRNVTNTPKADDDVWSANHPLGRAVDAVAALPGARVLGVQPMLRTFEPSGKVKEHFGFIDGISQPVPLWQGRKVKEMSDGVAVGEILLGYPDARKQTTRFTGAVDLFKNGSFMVMNKMSQDVEAFKTYLKDKPEDFKASLVGRKPDGTPLVDPRGGSTHNRFNYKDDQDGATCPFHAHIRRANPRDGGLPTKGPNPRPEPPRIMRRGFAYGPRANNPAARERGVIFMAYNASLANQYEVIQRWVNGGNSTGSLSSRGDVIAGLSGAPPDPNRQMALIQNGTVERFPLPKDPLVKMHWGMYLFVPSTAAIDFLATPAGQDRALHPVPGAPVSAGLGPSPGSGPLRLSIAQPGPPTAALIEQGEREIARLEGMREMERRLEWKRLLETRDRVPLARAVWAAIRARGGVFRSPVGLLAGSADAVKQILGREDLFSVRTYWARMSATLGETALGMDALPRRTEKLARTPQDDLYEKAVTPGRYQDESTAPNDYMTDISFGAAFATARAATERRLNEQRQKVPSGTRITVDVAELGARVLADLVEYWFGLPGQVVKTGEAAPSGNAAPRCPIDFALASQYIFRPDPGVVVTALAKQRGKGLLEAGMDLAKQRPRAGFLESLRQSGHGAKDPARTDEMLARAWITAVNGFVAPTFPHFLNVMNTWISDRELWRLKQWLSAPATAGGPPPELLTGEPSLDALKATPLLRGCRQAMLKDPVPDMLYREAIQNVDVTGTLANGQRAETIAIDAGELVIVGLASAANDGGGDTNFDLLFGGARTKDATLRHACPGQPMAMGAILGIAVGLMKQDDLRDRGVRLMLDCAGPQPSAAMAASKPASAPAEPLAALGPPAPAPAPAPARRLNYPLSAQAKGKPKGKGKAKTPPAPSFAGASAAAAPSARARARRPTGSSRAVR